MRSLDHLVPPPVVALGIAAGMGCLAPGVPMQRFELPWPYLTGLAVAAVGGRVSSVGAREFMRVRTTVNLLHPERASAIVTTGIYRFTRNPMGVGIVLVLVGWFLALGIASQSLSAGLGVPLFMAYLTRFQFVPEERVLAARLGAEYVDDRTRVRRCAEARPAARATRS